ncbi:hypothetical protein DYB26_002213 [Aphanomyces astaci]|uniref:tRNA (guanosine(18)-2'-O)-methyltransferase TARBP1 n=1 Tax=Aphanomyces astaci TaxID=112090 RepID=A0A418G019_APHAT|nr:hypothetical protein DYB26_002213 [Aphanomyces astaci]
MQSCVNAQGATVAAANFISTQKPGNRALNATVIDLCATGTVVSTLLHIDEASMTKAETLHARLSLALVKQCVDVAKRVDSGQKALSQALDDLVYNVCFPLLLPSTATSSLADDALGLLLHALGSIPSKDDMSWWESLRVNVVAAFDGAASSTSHPHTIADPTWLGYVVEFLFEQHLVSPSFVQRMLELCTAIISTPDTSFSVSCLFLRQAIFGSVVPHLIQHEAALASTLSSHVLTAWQPETLQDSLLMLCELFPHSPHRLHTAPSFHAILRLGLQHAEAVVRKMALHLLRAALATDDATVAHVSWGTFVHAFEIVHFHHEQHLLEQVWASIAALIRHTTIVLHHPHHSIHSTTDDKEAPSLFTAPLPFEWFQGIVHRCWHHDNPVVRRMTLVEFMAEAINTWHPSTAATVVLHPDVIPFVLTSLLPSLNDPFLFKHEKYRVRATTVAFCTRFLQLTTMPGSATTTLLTYLGAVQEAIFGDSTRGNSPDALVAMLAVFSELDHPPSPLLAADGLQVLRFIVHAHVLQSFPKIMTSLVPILQRILFEFTVPPQALPLEVVARYLLLFPTEHIQQHRAAFAAYMAPLEPAIHDALAVYFENPATLSTAALTRVVLSAPPSVVPSMAVLWSATPLNAHVCRLFQQLHSSTLATADIKAMVTTQLPPAYFSQGVALAFPSPSSAVFRPDDLPDQLAVVYVLTHIALHAMKIQGDCAPGHTLNAILVAAVAAIDDASPHDATFVVECLHLVAHEAPFLMDSLSVFDPQVLVPQLLGLTLRKPTTTTTYTQQFVLAKYAVLSSLLSTCWALPPTLLQAILDTTLDALPTAGNDPLVLEHMVHVIRMVLPFTVFNLPTDDDKQNHLDDVFSQVWTAYADSRKPNSLTHAVIQCVFQPRLMPLVDIFMYPKSAEPYVDEIITLLLYKEPAVDAKEQYVRCLQGHQSHHPPALKERFVRFVVLAFLEDAPLACHGLVDKLTTALLELQLKPEYQIPQMVNSDGFGRQLRSWQALCVLSRFVQTHTVDRIHELLWHKSFLNHNLPQIRYFIELFAMRVAVAFPKSSFPHIQALLQNVHLMPQLSASLLLVRVASVSLRLLPVDDTPQLHLDTLLLMVPWLNSTHGHTRTIVQFVALTLLPYFLAKEATASTVQFLQPTLRYLSTNKECKRMFRRQTDQMATFEPEKECTLAGLLMGTLNEFDEIVPISIVEQIKESLSASFAQFLKEDRRHGGQYQASVAGGLVLPSSAQEAPPPSSFSSSLEVPVGDDDQVIVQRKIDPNATAFLDELLAQTQAESLRDKQVNARRRRHQPVVVCASLVDKLPNVAGLARTCEIFNASKLLIPNMAMTHDILFRQISVTANKWVDMEEVPPSNVRSYLHRMKQQGYTVVALEQTSSSACLSTFVFPEKCVIVLGNEKEGIPVDILQAVDLCVEIPQMGVIRSLNVHVSGAILLWNYTQQRLLARQGTPTTLLP